MANELGLMSSFRERIYEPLVNFRGTDGKPGKEITLVEFAQKYAVNEKGEKGLLNGSGQPVGWDDILSDFGIDAVTSTLDNVLSLPGTDAKYLAPEMVRQFILDGMNTSANYIDLIAGSESVDTFHVTAPAIKMDDNTPSELGETESIPTTGFTWSQKTVEMKKVGVGIELSDSLLMAVKLPVLSYWLQRFGVMLGVKLYKEAIACLINGDQTVVADSAAVVGVASSGTLAFDDFVSLWSRANLIGQNWTTIVTSETMAQTVLKLAEFKPTAGGLGGAVINVNSRNRIIPGNLSHLISSDMDDDEILFLDPTKAMIRLSLRGLAVEAERIVQRQISGSYATVYGGWLNISREARIVLDKSIAFSGNGFPSYMVPLA